LSTLVLMEALIYFASAEYLKKAAALILGVAAVLTFLTAVHGFLLYLTGEYTGDLVEDHLWGGITLSFTVFVLFFIKQADDDHPFKSCYGVILAFMVGVLFYTGHNGDSITHGENYLTEYLPFWQPEEEPPKSIEEMLVFEDVVLPILQDKCVKCHGEKKVKGGLRLDSYGLILAGGDDEGPGVIRGGELEDSSIIYRITLDEDDDDVMPPEGKPQLTPDEKALLNWWVETGGENKVKVMKLKPGDKIIKIIERKMHKIDPEEVSRLREAVQPAMAAIQKKYGISLRFEGADSHMVSLNAKFAAEPFKDEDVAALAGLAENLLELNLEGSAITDAAMKTIAQYSHLKRLNLRNTQVTNAGMDALKGLAELEWLNLGQTEVGDASIPWFKEMEKLETGLSLGISVF